MALSAAVTGLSTVVLAVVTWYYVDLTGRLVLLGVEPSIEAGVDPRAWEAPNTFVVQNAGAVAVREAIVNIRCFLFRGSNDRSPMVFFQGLPWERKSSWWLIGTLRPAEGVRKDATDTLANCLRNRENQEKFENERAKAEAKGQGVQPIRLASLAVFDLSYQREVDRKAYRVSRPAWLHKDGKTGGPALQVPVISSDYQPFLEELTSGRVPAGPQVPGFLGTEDPSSSR